MAGGSLAASAGPGALQRDLAVPPMRPDAGGHALTPPQMTQALQFNRRIVTDAPALVSSSPSAAPGANWTFSKKAYHPTTITQQEGEGERNNPAVYNDKVGPSRNTGHDDYIGHTILEKFGTYRSNLTVADIKPPYAQAHNLDSDAKVAAHFFPGSSNHGTFTISAGDRMADQHGGMAGGDEAKAQLAAPKQVEKILDQTYESEPGTALGRYTITRILKTDGSKKITKKKI